MKMEQRAAMSEDLLEAMAQITDAPKVMQRGGKAYTQVQDRIEAFRKVFAFDTASRPSC